MKFDEFVKNDMIPAETVLLGYAGSISHGTHIPKEDPDSIDDIDLMGIAFGAKSVYVGLQKFEQKVYHQDEWDITVYEIRKFFRLLLKQNPNVLGLLWLSPNNYLRISPVGNLILENKNLFTSKQAYHSFIGYAYGQLHRMEHYKFNGYMGQKRKEIVDKFGYDVKNASHLIRLLRMGVEYLGDGVLHVYRKDADELKEIKSGKWTMAKVKEESDRLFSLAQESFVKSPLPPVPDSNAAQKLLEQIVMEYLR